jgi:hypothetical protein
MKKMSASLLVGLMLVGAASGNAQEAVERMTTREVHEHLIEVQSAYHERDAASYRFGVQELLDDARGASPPELHARLREVVTVGIRSGFDGLEPLVVALGDALAKDASGVAPAELSLTLASLDRNLRFTRPVAPNLRMPLGRLDSRVVRSLRGEALRTAVEAIAAGTLHLGAIQLDAALADPGVQEDLCALELRVDELGEIAAQELEREARCQAIQGQVTLQQPDTGLLDAFADLACLAEKDGTAGVGELEKLFQQCVADSVGDGRPSAAFDENLDGVWGFREKQENGEYPWEMYLRERQATGSLAKWGSRFTTDRLRSGEAMVAAMTAVRDFAERQADEEAIVAWEEASKAADEAFDEWADAVTAAEEALARAVDGSGTVEAATQARERADELREKLNKAREKEEQARQEMEKRRNSMPSEEGRVNRDSEACQDLLSLLSSGKLDYDSLTGSFRPPAYEQPDPEAESDGGESVACGLSTDGVPSSGGGCEEQVLCPEGMSLNESCGCDNDAVSAVEQAKIAGYCPFEFVCDGEIVVENGLCSCETPEAAVDTSGPMPPPPPDPAEGTSVTLASQTSLPSTPAATTTVQSASSTTTSTSSVISPTTTMTSSPLRTLR